MKWSNMIVLQTPAAMIEELEESLRQTEAAWDADIKVWGKFFSLIPDFEGDYIHLYHELNRRLNGQPEPLPLRLSKPRLESE